MNIKRLPKIDLHLHLDGAIRVTTLAALGDDLGVKLPTCDPKKLAKFVQVDRDCRSLTDFLKRFEIIYPILPYAQTQERIGYELCEDCARDNVIYFETRFAPMLACSERFTPDDAVAAALEGLRRGQRDFGVRCGLILCCYRSITPQQNIETVKLAHKYRRQGVVGIDLAGDENRFPAGPHAEAFALARQLEIPITIHAGEGGRPENIREAVFEHGATRIGHGISLQRDPELLKQVRDQGTVFEICLTSNLQTCSVPSLAAHPFGKFLDEKVRVTLNTDDPAISNIALTDEFELAARTCKLTEADVHGLLVTAAEAAFAEASVRRQLVSRLGQ
ncbi:MAG TPA: adenosine deaminase [Verrucomicrobiae bacterium]|nr:adenosine deaminase [Verrucomicrobiae bacterium]